MTYTADERIWDVHCHLTGIGGDTPEVRLGRLVGYARRMGIERVCVSMGTRFVHRPAPDDLREQNDEVLRAITAQSNHAFGFCYVSGEHVEASLREMERCIADGPMVGVKLWVARRASEASLDALVDRTRELKAVILQHTWRKTDGTQLPGETTPSDLVALAGRWPGVPFIAAHAGGTWEVGIRAFRQQPNIYIDTAGFDPTSGFLEMALRELGPQRVVFGSDAPGRSFASQLAKVVGPAVAPPVRELILRENLRRLLAPILHLKGWNL